MDAPVYAEAVSTVIRWANAAESRYVCLGTVNNLIHARDSRAYRHVLERADLLTPDGMPLVWMLRGLGLSSATRVYGPDLMAMILAAAEEAGIPVGFYGGSPKVLRSLSSLVQQRYPCLRLAFAEAPPFRPLTSAEQANTVRALESAGVRILFVGLGSPKQDLWMHAHKGRIHAVMLGVGAAFDFFTGAKPQAPRWMQQSGLEWAFRLSTEPRRLWRRYLTQNPRFVVLAAAQLLRDRMT